MHIYILGFPAVLTFVATGSIWLLSCCSHCCSFLLPSFLAFSSSLSSFTVFSTSLPTEAHLRGLPGPLLAIASTSKQLFWHSKRFDFPAKSTLHFFNFPAKTCHVTLMKFKQASTSKDSFLFSCCVQRCTDLLCAFDPSFLLFSAHEPPTIPRARKARSLSCRPGSGLFCLLR